MSLKEYNRKRNFKKTAEPAGNVARKRSHRFVVQKHDASRLHYDFRLEMDGTLKSWAVPKGVPFAKGEKRLALEVEDHPVSYINFEGTIPKGQYGGGTVMVWDCGTYEALTLSDNPSKELAGGKLHFILHGRKLAGEWYLVRMRDWKNWLLVRGHDSLKPISHKLDDTSAISGRSMAAISKGNKIWNSKAAKRAPAEPKSERSVPPKSFPRFIEPMKARLADCPSGGQWLYEIKLDGFRTLAFINGSSVHLLSRNDKDFNQRFPKILEAVKQLGVDNAVIDGEIVALDAEGRSSFQLLQAYDLGQEKPPIYYYAFDLLRYQGRDLQNLPLTERKELLKNALEGAPDLIRNSTALSGDVSRLSKEAQRLGLEGLIGKRADSVYEAGKRSGAWIKLKLQQEQEMVIGGFTEPEGSRHSFGSLVVGYYDKTALICAGKVGTGFNDALLSSLAKKFKSISSNSCPFKNLPEKKTGDTARGSRQPPCDVVTG